MTSPYVEAHSKSTRTEREVRSAMNIPRTFYTLFVRWPDEIRLFTHEGPVSETKEQLFHEMDQITGSAQIAAIIRCDDDSCPRDVTQEIFEEYEQAYEDAI